MLSSHTYLRHLFGQKGLVGVDRVACQAGSASVRDTIPYVSEHSRSDLFMLKRSLRILTSRCKARGTVLLSLCNTKAMTAKGSR